MGKHGRMIRQVVYWLSAFSLSGLEFSAYGQKSGANAGVDMEGDDT